VIARVAVRGRVQGVGFRWFAREHARRLGLAGWVRNCADGSVEAAAAGSDAAVEEFLAVLRRGPDGARVDDLVSLPPAEKPALESPFTVIR
jgi:acylphosphatase